ncbi:hypothetical protein MTR67_003694 [Solanum verrucosum]|uniref:Uncharacterized protein n=1 Tax=Solanum verrucosum TaxID=315347 RepID=A0AAF0PYJ2_SOLVR|nr:hypothetical protein MTR67_003694 [Solanum verrucosum]
MKMRDIIIYCFDVCSHHRSGKIYYIGKASIGKLKIGKRKQVG